MPALSLLEIILIVYLLLAFLGLIFTVWKYIKQANTLKIKNQNEEELQRKNKNLQDELIYLKHKFDHESREKLHEAVLDNTGNPVLILDSKKNIREANKAALILIGKNIVDIFQKPISEIISPATAENIFELIPFDSMELGTVFSLPQNLMVNILGKSLPIAGSVTKFSYDNDQYYVFSFTDNSQLYAENLLNRENILSLNQKLESYQNFEDVTYAFIQKTDICIFSLDNQGNIIYMNPQAELFTHQTLSQVKGYNFRHALHLVDKKDIPSYSFIDESLAGVKTVIPKWIFFSYLNSKTAIRGSCFPANLKNSSNGVIMYFFDAQKEYEREADDQATFSAAAHDLRAPLSNIRGVLELNLSNPEIMTPEKSKDLMQGALDSVLHLINLVNDLLSVSRIEQGRVEIKKEVFDISDLTESIIADFIPQAKERQIYLKHDLTGETLPKVFGDKNKTAEVLTNLISNGLKYTPKGGVTVSHKNLGLKVSTVIKDTGFGISKDNQKLLFQKFQQVGSARGTSISKSTGLGLYLSKKFALLMNGDINLINSDLEKGSEFEFTLPIGPG